MAAQHVSTSIILSFFLASCFAAVPDFVELRAFDTTIVIPQGPLANVTISARVTRRMLTFTANCTKIAFTVIFEFRHFFFPYTAERATLTFLAMPHILVVLCREL